ncbi:transporter substrate-binding domain-containing protein [Microbulbifer salipaludis]|uniref:Transporter substrate-binding domain-containing protein n=1 Tax=Microbulbifer salipaludis TaxID=187980 RepID=A0ABS3EAU1_9GAMM|nr:transporter substrate-binding domain-containing protein [Microbulbifer salipaludis]MBN8432427.1 transporter substrate-binding domain-containing protein [Microbulbifer salipaludis]
MNLPSVRGILCCLLPLLLCLSACQRDVDAQSGKETPAQGAAETIEEQSPAGSDAPPTTPDADENNAADQEKAMRMAGKDDVRPEAAWAPETTGEFPINAYDNYVDTGDLSALREHGKLRILVDISNTDSLHRAATQQDIEIDAAKRMARQMGLEPVVLYAENFDQLLPLLEAGKGDIIANNLVMTEERKQQVDFSIPTANTELILVSEKDAEPVTDDSDLSGKTLAVTKGTAYETAAREFAKKHPGLKLKVTEKNYVELVIDVAESDLDYTVVERQVFDLVDQFKDNLQENYVFPGERQMAWGVRKNSPELVEAINKFVRDHKLTRTSDRSVGDLDEIKKRGYVRVVTRNHPGTYYMWKGRILGYEFELAESFAKDLDVRLEIVVAPTHADLLTYVVEGKADIAASLLSATQRRDDQGVDFGRPYMKEKVVVVGEENDKIDSLDDLAGRTLHVRKSSNHYDVALKVKQQVPDVKIELAPEELNIQQIIDKVADNDYDLTIADDVSVKLEHSWRKNIKELIDLHEDDNVYVWLIREGNPKLQEAVNAFFDKKSTQKKMAVLYTKYFDAPKRTRPEINEVNENGTISPFDKYVKKYADKYDFDWRLVVAQMFQESTFNPKAKSWVGARGLMQVMPDTGKQIGEKNLFDPETSVRAGIKYLEWLHRKFEDKGISPENMMWFTLASYNAGLGHVYDAQDLAEQKGWDRRVWFNNVENAMLLLSEKKYYEKARYGYARGQEPYDYVRKINARFRTYVALLEDYERRQEVETGMLLDPLYPEFLQLSNLAGRRQPAVAATPVSAAVAGH